MCTLSWELTPNGYHVYFNRDEQISRAKALIPRLNSALSAIYPIDPQAGGTWIATNQSGTTYCLLNNYQATEQALLKGKKAIKSRGLIILELLKLEIMSTKAESKAQTDNLLTNQIYNWLTADELNQIRHYAPFTLCVFPSGTSQQNTTVTQFSWDGESVSFAPAHSPLTSSGFNFAAVQQARLATYAQINKPHLDLLRFQASHLPGKGAYSVCMHRDDAQTQSLTHIAVSPNQVLFNYLDSPPCQSTEFIKLSMPQS